MLIAQVQGGKTPYVYTWSDPTLEGPGPHRVCPTQPTAYSVVVSDGSEIIGGEFAQPAQEVEAQGKVDCVDDAGAGLTGCFTSSAETDAGLSDGGTGGVTCEEKDDAGIKFEITTGVVVLTSGTTCAGCSMK